MTPDTLREEPLPCPFCGGESAIKSRVEQSLHRNASQRLTRVACVRCQASSGYYASEFEAIAAWNRRAPVVPVAPTREAVAFTIQDANLVLGVPLNPAISPDLTAKLDELGHRIADYVRAAHPTPPAGGGEATAPSAVVCGFCGDRPVINADGDCGPLGYLSCDRCGSDPLPPEAWVKAHSPLTAVGVALRMLDEVKRLQMRPATPLPDAARRGEVEAAINTYFWAVGGYFMCPAEHPKLPDRIAEMDAAKAALLALVSAPAAPVDLSAVEAAMVKYARAYGAFKDHGGTENEMLLSSAKSALLALVGTADATDKDAKEARRWRELRPFLALDIDGDEDASWMRMTLFDDNTGDDSIEISPRTGITNADEYVDMLIEHPERRIGYTGGTNDD